MAMRSKEAVEIIKAKNVFVGNPQRPCNIDRVWGI